MAQYNPRLVGVFGGTALPYIFGESYPMNLLTSLINGLHNTIGISTPPPDKVVWAAAIWVVSIGFIVLVLFVLLEFIV